MRTLLAVLTIAPVLGVRADAQSTCRDGDWSTPRVIWFASNDSASIQPLDAAADAHQLVVTALAAARVVDSLATIDPATAIAIRVDLVTGRSVEIRRPARRMSYDALRVAIDGRGVAHLFWREIAGLTTDDSTGGAGAIQIWTSRIQADSMGLPELIISTRNAVWTAGGARPAIGTDGRGRVHLVVLNPEGFTRFPLLHLMRDEGGWSVHKPDLGRAFITQQVGMAISHNTLDVAFTSPNFDHRKAWFGSLYFVQASLESMQWSPVRLIRDAGDRPAADPTVTRAGQEIRVFWKLAADSLSVWNDHTMQVATSEDGSQFVQRDTLHVTKSVLEMLRTYTDKCGVTVVAAHSGGATGPVAPMTMRWDGAHWSWDTDPRIQFEYPGYSVVTAGTPGRVTRVWSSVLYGPYLPTLFMWFESHRAADVPAR